MLTRNRPRSSEGISARTGDKIDRAYSADFVGSTEQTDARNGRACSFVFIPAIAIHMT